MSTLSERLNEIYGHLIVLSDTVQENLQLYPYLYKDKNILNYHIVQELSKYDVSSADVSSIMYMSADSATPVSSKYLYKYKDGKFIIYQTDLNDAYPKLPVIFDPALYLNSPKNQILLLSNESSPLLLYLPTTDVSSDSYFIYTLNTKGIEEMMRSIMPDNFSAIALVDSSKTFAVEVNGEILAPCLDSIPLTSGFYTLDASTSICVQTGIFKDFTLISQVPQIRSLTM